MVIKIKTINNQQVTELVMRILWVLWMCGTWSNERDNNQTKKLFCHLNLPVTLISGKKWLHGKWMTILSYKTSQKVQIMRAVLFWEIGENYARM